MEIKKVLKKIKLECSNQRGCLKYAFFSNKNDELQIICIVENEDTDVKLYSFTEEGEKTGYMHLVDEGESLFLSEIYTLTKFRGKGIGKNLNSFVEYYYSNSNKKFIYGKYSPQQMGEDKLKRVEVGEEELNNRAKFFYMSNDYKIFDLDDYLKKNIDLNDKLSQKKCSKFKMLRIHNRPNKLIYKDISKEKEKEFILKNGYYLHKNLNNKDVNDLVNTKSKNNSLREKLLLFGWNENKIDNFLRLNNEYNLLDIKDVKKINIPKDLIEKIKNLLNIDLNYKKEFYEELLNIYLEMEERYVVIKKIRRT